MGWLTDSFEQHSVAWIVISAFVGGVLGSGTKFLFEDVFRPRLGLRRDAKAVLARFTTPLMREQFQRWFHELDEFLAAVPDDPFRWDRLIAAGANLRILVRLLERSAGVRHEQQVANLDLLRHEQVHAMLDEELAESTRSLTWRRGANKQGRR